MNDAFATAVRIAVSLLVRGEYETLASMTRGRRLSAAELSAAVREYGRHLVLPPSDWWNDLDVVSAAGSSAPAHHVVVPLWTCEEGRSDLTLELVLTDAGDGSYDVEVAGLHVL